VAFKQKIAKEEAELFVKEFFSVIRESLSEDNPVKIKDFGTFKLTLIQARESVDVNTGEKIEIPAHYRFSFSPATALKELVNKPFSNFETTLLSAGFQNDNIPLAGDENDDENDEDDIIFIVEKNVSEETAEIQYEVESKVVESKTKTPTVVERKSQKQPLVGLLGVAVASAAIIAMGLLFRKK
jgi:nucleoid DNA-binding protein